MAITPATAGCRRAPAGPTILGWAGHEHQWRGTREPLEGRAEDVRRIYSGRDPAEATRLLQKYGVRYVYVGRRERDSYGEAGLTDFGGFMEPFSPPTA